MTTTATADPAQTYSVQVMDETTAKPQPQLMHTLDFDNETVTVRELLRRRVYEDCTEYNAQQGEAFRGLVTPDPIEDTLNAKRTGKAPRVRWETQFDKAQEAFEAGGFVVLVGDEQVDDLDEQVTLKLGQPLEVTFIKLIPLVGG